MLATATINHETIRLCNSLHAGLYSRAFAAPQTMRLDYYHTGTATEEVFSVDRIVLEPLPWPGDPARAIDDTNLGKYFFEVRDQQTKAVLYSRGFASIYGEWETTDEAKTLRGRLVNRCVSLLPLTCRDCFEETRCAE